MSFQRLVPMHGIYNADEIALLQRVLDQISQELNIPEDTESRSEMARYIFRMYAKGLCIESKLHEFCLAAARQKLKPNQQEAVGVHELAG